MAASTGITSGVNWFAILAWACGAALFFLLRQLTFLSTTIGATFIDMVFSGVIYYGLMKLWERRRKQKNAD